ncbi:uncharacterized protein LOC113874951 [Abrus precatorius]|uniref:Uncharacterized protein LOC113874951 n=1 Tax=Abrus precatorius TaxID=3816 RepID=A0A8B8MMF5_ABRPR|nr:uncharacterized protein LOC113874951 [Abrus precatorius]
MKEEDPTVTPSLTTNPKTKRDNSNGVVPKGHYMFWVLAAIILLALWSMFTGSLTLKWSATNLTRHFDPTTVDDLDVLEVEEREKVVRRMWDVYTHSISTRLPRFWYDAFHAAYEHLVSDVPGVRDAAVSEIAKMSLHSLNLHPLSFHLKSDLLGQNMRGSRKMKQAENSVDTTFGSNQ